MTRHFLSRLLLAVLLPLLAVGTTACGDSATSPSVDGTAPGVARTSTSGLKEGEVRIVERDASGTIVRSEISSVVEDLRRSGAHEVLTRADSANLIAVMAFLSGSNTKPGRAQVLPLQFKGTAITLYALERSATGRMKRFGFADSRGRDQYVVAVGTGKLGGRLERYTDGHLTSSVQLAEVSPALGANAESGCLAQFLAAMAGLTGGVVGILSGNPIGWLAGISALLYGLAEMTEFWSGPCGTSFFEWIEEAWASVSDWWCEQVSPWCEEL